MAVRRHPTTNPTLACGSVRIDTIDRASHDFHQSFYMSSGSQRTGSKREVEVQAFRPDTRGGGTGPVSVVALVIHGPGGMADVMLSSAEARDVAIVLLAAAADADRIAS